MNWPVFFKRLGSAIIFSGVMMLGLLYPDPFAIFILAFVIQFFCLREFLRLCRHIFPDGYFPVWIHPATQIAGGVALFSLAIPELSFVALLVPSGMLLAGILVRNTSLKAVFCSLVAILYISIPLGLLVALRGMHISIPIALILLIWINDTMAYLVGSFIGRTPFSDISPKKTWEGTIGGVIFTLVAAYIWGQYADGQIRYANFYTYDWVVMAIVVCFAGTAGDLLESKLKRLAGVKDSGTLMPGHGGALDRFDSLLMTTPFVFFYFWLTTNGIS